MTYTHVPAEDSPLRRAVGLALFLLPIGYVAEILSVAVHEILGHGLSAALLGGTFYGFMAKWDGMGLAFCDLPATAPLWHEVLHLASGILVEIVCGAGFWGLASLFRRRADVQVVLLIASSICLLDAASYMLWNAYHPVPPGDIGRIIWLSSVAWPSASSVLRWMLLAIGALLFAGTTLCFYPAIFARVETLIAGDHRLAGWSRLIALLAFLVLPNSIGWLVFDWDQLAPGIGRLPGVAGVLSVVAVAGLLFRYRPRWKESGSPGHITRRHIAASWTGLIVTVLALAFWFDRGVLWGSREATGTPRIIGPFAISGSDKFLFCGVEKNSLHRSYLLVPLAEGHHEPIILSLPDSDRCLGAMWRPGVDPDELLFVTAGKEQAIKRFRVSDSGVEGLSSYPVAPNLLVTVRSDWWSPDGKVLALRVTKFEGGAFSGAYVGFSKDDGKTVRISTVPATMQLSWASDHALYLTYAVDTDATTGSEVEGKGPAAERNGLTMTVSKVELDSDSLTPAMHDVLCDNDVAPAMGCLKGSFLYAKGDTLFCDGKALALLPEKIGRPMVDGDYLAVGSADEKRIYMLDVAGEILDVKETPDGSSLLGVSAGNKLVYWVASSPENRTRIWAYNFIEKQESVVIEAGDVALQGVENER